MQEKIYSYLRLKHSIPCSETTERTTRIFSTHLKKQKPYISENYKINTTFFLLKETLLAKPLVQYNL